MSHLMDIASVAFEIINIDHIDYPFDIGPLKSDTNAIATHRNLGE